MATLSFYYSIYLSLNSFHRTIKITIRNLSIYVICIYLLFYITTTISIYVFIYVYSYLSIYNFTQWLSNLPIFLSIYLSFYNLPIYLSIIYLSIIFLSISTSLRQFIQYPLNCSSIHRECKGLLTTESKD